MQVGFYTPCSRKDGPPSIHVASNWQDTLAPDGLIFALTLPLKMIEFLSPDEQACLPYYGQNSGRTDGGLLRASERSEGLAKGDNRNAPVRQSP